MLTRKDRLKLFAKNEVHEYFLLQRPVQGMVRLFLLYSEIHTTDKGKVLPNKTVAHGATAVVERLMHFIGSIL